ncbi:hypothetical protein [Haloprofundus salilacus]|uniref:hypothetical protein n=1 Tax=Haloprofundus salilacus TaxID=2876190 RepID=UPI001CCCCAF3|nr:hypothetical protein [Haloprofundus salilacus]
MTAVAECEESTTEMVALTIVGETDDTSVELTRSIRVTCVPDEGPSSLSMQFTGCGNAFVDGEFETKEVTVVTGTGQESMHNTTTTVEPGEKVRAVPNPPKGRILALVIDSHQYENDNDCRDRGSQ